MDDFSISTPATSHFNFVSRGPHGVAVNAVRAAEASSSAEEAVVAMKEQYKRNQATIATMLRDLETLQDAAKLLGEGAEEGKGGGGDAKHQGTDGLRKKNAPLGRASDLGGGSLPTASSPFNNHTPSSLPKPSSSAFTSHTSSSRERQKAPSVDVRLLRRVLEEQEGRVEAEMRGGGIDRTLFGPQWYLSSDYWRAFLRRYMHIWLPVVVMVYFNRNAIYFCWQIIFVGPVVEDSAQPVTSSSTPK